MSRHAAPPAPRRSPPGPEGRAPPEPASPCAVLFSGGSDSTLAAALMARRFAPVHLLTFDRRTVRGGPAVYPGLRNLGLSRINAQRLGEVLGRERFVHTVEDTTSLFRRIAVEGLADDLARFGTRLTLLVCMGCKLAMHAHALALCRERGIGHVADGASRAEALYPEQNPRVMRRLGELYAEHGIEYANPVYDLAGKRSIHDALRRFGIEMGAPPEGLLSARRWREAFLAFDTQAWCLFGLKAAAYDRLYYGPLHGGERENDALAYLESKMGIVRAFLSERERASRG